MVKNRKISSTMAVALTLLTTSGGINLVNATPPVASGVENKEEQPKEEVEGKQQTKNQMKNMSVDSGYRVIV